MSLCTCISNFLLFQDKVDDVLLGIKSTAIKFGDNTKLWLSGFGSSMIGGLVLSGMSCGIGWPYYASVAAVASHLASQVFNIFIIIFKSEAFCINLVLLSGVQARHKQPPRLC